MRGEFLIIRPADPTAEWSLDKRQIPLGSKTQGLFDSEGVSLLARIGIVEPIDSITLETWGDADPLPKLSRLCVGSGWQAMDLDSWRFVAPERA